jgi:branched-subunit amino acid aminotransferase/4-amino-4-deoxychorismate lyase
MPKPISRIPSAYAREAAELLGLLIRSARVERGLTIADLAERAGVSRGLVHRVEQGDPGCSLGAAFELAAIVGVRRDEGSFLAGIKSIDYLVTVMARREAAEYGLDEALLLNGRGFIAEGGNSNVFFVRNGTVGTPSLGAGILPGIIRRLVLELAGETGIPVREGDVCPEDLHLYEEAFMTSSVIEVMPLVGLRDASGTMRVIGAGRPGPVTRKLMAAYTERVKRDTGC